MVKSILDRSVEYPELKNIDPEDREKEVSVYEISIEYVLVNIALGTAKYAYVEDQIVYFPIYLLKNDKVLSQIGVFEITESDLPNIVDKDGDPILTKLSSPLLYSFVKDNDYELLREAEVASELDEEVLIETIKKMPGKEDEIELIKEEDSYAEQPNDLWIQKYLKSRKYNIKDNEGGGECLFAAIRDGLETVGITKPVSEMRSLLSKEANEELLLNYRKIYEDNAKLYKDIVEQLKDLVLQNKALKEALKQATDRATKAAIVAQAKEVADTHKLAKENKEIYSNILQEFSWISKIKTLKKLKEVIQTCDFWGDTWAISTLERILNVKLILFSEQGYIESDFDNVLLCGQLNDKILEEKGTFSPMYYIMLTYSGNHYKLLTYNNKGALTFNELPNTVKELIKLKCLERMSGPYAIINDFRKYVGLTGKEEVPIEEPEEALLHDDLTELQIYEKAADKPWPGQGNGEKLGPEGLTAYTRLKSSKDWRRKLDKSWIQPFSVDGLKWNSVEHFVQGSKFKQNNPEFYKLFAVDSASEISKNVDVAKAAADKTGKLGDIQIRPASIKPDLTWNEARESEALEKATRAKFTQNPDLAELLKETKRSKISRFIRGKPSRLETELMSVRREIK